MIECTDSDETLMVRILTEREAFSCLVARYEEKLLRYIRRLMPGLQDEAYDVLQEIFIKVYVNARGFDSQLSFSSWIYRIAHNEAVNWLRKKKSRPVLVELDDDDVALLTKSVDDANEKDEVLFVKDEVVRVFGKMSEKYRSVLVLRFLEGKSYGEMSDILTVPEGTVATLIHRAKKEFSSIYKKHHAQ